MLGKRTEFGQGRALFAQHLEIDQTHDALSAPLTVRDATWAIKHRISVLYKSDK